MQPDLDHCLYPIDFYRLFLNDEVLNIIIRETNRNIEKFIILKTPLQRQNMQTTYQSINSEELLKFFGLLLWMGLVRLPKIRDYWSKNPFFTNRVAPNLFTRDPFLVILRFLHFENEDSKTNDRLYKIKPLLNALLEAYKKWRFPGENLVIDETMVTFRERLLFRQYIPGKAQKYGIKLFKLCDSKAYMYGIKDSGKDTRTEATGLYWN